jgi:hypothetical protein
VRLTIDAPLEVDRLSARGAGAYAEIAEPVHRAVVELSEQA